MMSNTLIAVAAPITHTETGVPSQTSATPVAVGNYLGGVAILTILVVMILSGLSAAGMVSFRRSHKLAPSDTARPVH